MQANDAAEKIRLYSVMFDANFQRYDRYGDLIEGSDGILNRLQTLERTAVNGSTNNFTVMQKRSGLVVCF